MRKNKKEWYVYLVRCRDNSLYCGIAKDVFEREKLHNAGKGAKYTRSRRPVEIVVCKGPFTKSAASKIEYQVKQQKAKDKIDFLINYETTKV